MSIKRLTNNNIKSHKETTVELCPSVNCIYGLTDGGKSSLLSGIEWIVTGKPVGEVLDTWVTDGTKRSEGLSSTVEFADGTTVRRVKNNKENCYYVNDDRFIAGTSVPLPVQQALQLNSVNIQQQHSELFLFNAKPGEIGKYLNSLVDLESIDLTLTKAATTVDKLNAEIKANKRITEQKTKELEHFPALVGIEANYDLVVKLHDSIQSNKDCKVTLEKYSADLLGAMRVLRCCIMLENVKKQLAKVQAIYTQVQTIQQQRAVIFKLRAKLAKVCDVLANVAKVADLSTKYKACNTLSTKIYDLTNITKSLRSLYDQLKTIDNVLHNVTHFNHVHAELIKVQQLCDEMRSKKADYNNFIKLIAVYKKYNSEIVIPPGMVQHIRLIHNLKEQFNKLLDEYTILEEYYTSYKSIVKGINMEQDNLAKLRETYKQMYPDQCPFCERIIK